MKKASQPSTANSAFLIKTALSFVAIFICLSVFSQEDKRILNIRDCFNNWQPIIENDADPDTEYFKYAWGMNYEHSKWYSEPLERDTVVLNKAIAVYQVEDLGTLVRIGDFSLSGDWVVNADHYYSTTERLYFVFWRMNTFYAEEPVTVEKRLYFDQEEIIRELVGVYKMNTNEKTNISYLDREVDYELKLDGLELVKTPYKKRPQHE